MATVLLSAAGSAIGGSIGGSLLGVGSAAIGQAVGATLGGLIDNAVLGGGSSPVQLGKREALQLPKASEGEPIARLFGRMRCSGQLIWSTRFKENVSTSSQGGKATSQTVREYSYSISFALGLCEGKIDRIGRVWADGNLFDLSSVSHRLYRGDDTQLPDEKIEAVEGVGNAPAYRGLAYIVFEDFPIKRFGNRVPVLNFEVIRSANVSEELAAQHGFTSPLRELVSGVCLSPGTGEFALDPQPVHYKFPNGSTRYANINNSFGKADILASLDELDGDLPNCNSVSLVVSWFGTDLRCGECQVRPQIEEPGRKSAPFGWSVAGLTTSNATQVSLDDEVRPNFGGTPSDGSVVRAIQELKARGKRVVFYPFLLMDIPASNELLNPYTGLVGQPTFPWRGRITSSLAPGLPGSPDKMQAAHDEVESFFGSASAADFSIANGTSSYSGPGEWRFRRFILHYAALCALAGGVDGFCVGSELRGLTTLRAGEADFPAVAELKSLVAEVRHLLPQAKIGYAADWSEYFGYHPQDGSGDLYFHLDALWSDENIDFVGIDNYFPMSDWRHGAAHLDKSSGAKSVYDASYLQANIEGGEGYDWYYTSQLDRDSQLRTPISDGAYGEDWVWRPKDLRSWWSNSHHDRPNGVRSGSPTAWVPKSKPIWFTEVGVPAVDLGTNEPNKFVDRNSSESALPFGSRGNRDDLIQSAGLAAVISYWSDPENNPTSPVYGDRMIPGDGIFVWNWDARPWPDFPMRESVWKDGPNHATGHWISGRISSGALSEAVAEVVEQSGLTSFDVSRLSDQVDGYLVDSFATGRELLQPLALVHAFGVRQSRDLLEMIVESEDAEKILEVDGLVLDLMSQTSAITRQIGAEAADVGTVQVYYSRGDLDFRLGVSEARCDSAGGGTSERVSVPIFMPAHRAEDLASRRLSDGLNAAERITFRLPLSHLGLEPGDILQLDDGSSQSKVMIDRVVGLLEREVEAIPLRDRAVPTATSGLRQSEAPSYLPPAPLAVQFIDLPIATGSVEDAWPWVAVHADPWPGDVLLYRSASETGFEPIATITRPAMIGETLTPLVFGQPDRWQSVDNFRVSVRSGALSSSAELDVLNGENRLAVQWPDGAWEIIQFCGAELVGENEYALHKLLRGQRDTMWGDRWGTTLPANAPVVVLDKSLVQVPLESELRGLDRNYRAASVDVPIDHFSVASNSTAFMGLGIKPFAPAHLRVQQDYASGAFEASWVRTTRVGGDSWQGLDVPSDEPDEKYFVEIVSNGEIVRSVTVTGNSFSYSLDDQLDDGLSSDASIRVARVSQVFGPGNFAEIELNV